jgi:hypothetical protein
MNLFRSEEHVERWLGGRTPGATTSIGTLALLAHRWWGDRLSPTWVPHTRGHNQAILDSLGLTDGFWQLPHARR